MIVKCKKSTCLHRTSNGYCSMEEIKIDSNIVCHSFKDKTGLCTCYHKYEDKYGNLAGKCWGTRDCEVCYCGGYVDKCDFYEKGVLE